MTAPVLITAAAVAPVSLEQVKAHLRIDHSDEDPSLQTYIDAATGWLGGPNGILGKTLVGETWRQTYAAFVSPLVLAATPNPVASVTQVRYRGIDGVQQVLDETAWSLIYGPVAGETGSFYQIVAPTGQSWPPTAADDDAVWVDYVAGYGEPSQVPAPIRQAILLLVGDFYAHRETSDAQSFTELPYALRMLLSNFRAPVI